MYIRRIDLDKTCDRYITARIYSGKIVLKNTIIVQELSDTNKFIFRRFYDLNELIREIINTKDRKGSKKDMVLDFLIKQKIKFGGKDEQIFVTKR
ncbi:MAG: hypothetical protein LBD17_02735 [Endomicrobium sp.]|jgi:hypothetical protein|nr:hypothetical protein [Endomicrobium sp.]